VEHAKVSETCRIPAFFDELYGIEDQDHGYGKDGEDGDDNEEFYEGEARYGNRSALQSELRSRGASFILSQARDER